MARSKRKSHFKGMAGDSDKYDKQKSARQHRIHVKDALKKEREILPDRRELVDNCSFNKDGKFFIDKDNEKHLRK